LTLNTGTVVQSVSAKAGETGSWMRRVSGLAVDREGTIALIIRELVTIEALIADKTGLGCAKWNGDG
jgi:hypothetical protein